MRRAAVKLAIGLLILLAFLSSACASRPTTPRSRAVQQTGSRRYSRRLGRRAAQAVTSDTPMKIGLLVDFTGGLAEFGEEMRLGFELAIEHLNAAGGVLGHPVEFVIADSALEPLLGVEEARRLVEVEGVHAIVGPLASAVTLPVAESVTGPSRIPQIALGTSPLLTTANDDDFLFRTTLSDVSQGPVIAQLIRDRGFSNVGALYRDDPWGQGFADALSASWDGPLELVAIDPRGTSFLAELQRSGRSGAEALIVLAFAIEAEVIIREALEQGLYDQFVFGPGGNSLALLEAIGPEHLGGMYGTGPTPSPPTDSSAAWADAFEAKYGRAARTPYVKETYDAVIALALAAQAAGSLEGPAIRDQLRQIGAAPGVVVSAGPDGVAEALRIVRAGGELDYQGAAVTLDWDEHGDLSRGYVGIWRFTREGSIELVEAVPYGQ